MFSLIARVLITTYLVLQPPEKLLTTYLIYAFIQCLGYWIISIGHFAPNYSILLYYLGVTIFGIGRGVFAFPYLTIIRIFNKPEHESLVNIWIALSMGGNAWGFLLETGFEDLLKLDWYISLSIFSALYFITAIIAKAGVL